MNIDGKTKIYGIIGRPVSHSLSPAMHNAAFAGLEENAVYLPFHVEDVKAALTGLKGLHVSGVSVTIPHKEEVMKYLDEIDPVAEKIGAVNTIAVRQKEDGIKLHGFNTDWIGANKAIEQKLDPTRKKMVILGAGGSARAIGFGLLEVGAEIVLCSRTESRGKSLAADLGCPWISLSESENLVGDVLINATSVGMTPNVDSSPVPGKVLKNFQVVMDIVYAPLQTRLLREAQAAGPKLINGLEMLLYQGVAQFELWTGLKAPVEIMKKVLYRQTGNDQ